jgi:hypothetical protein
VCAVDASPDGDGTRSMLDLHSTARGPQPLGAKPDPIAAANRATAHDRRIHPQLGLMVLDRQRSPLRDPLGLVENSLPQRQSVRCRDLRT